MMLDAYSRRARLMPAALAAAPATVLLGAGISVLKGIASVTAIILGAIAIALCGLVRQAGRRLEARLWESWGGPPTTRLLRWRDGTSTAATERLHARVSAALGCPLPTRAEEANDPEDADLRYQEAIAALRELTRDRKQFPLVAEEVAEYGFRRNTLGLRPIGIAVAAAITITSLAALVAGDAGHPTRFIIAAAVGALAVLGWTLGVRPQWVRTSAELYATRLLETAETLSRRPA
jgi:hypothetical protein